MLEEKNLVSYLDILGFKEMLYDYLSGNHDIKKTIERALKEAKLADELFKGVQVKLKNTQFSDCRCISIQDISNDYPNFEEVYLDILIYFLIYLREIQMFLLNNEIYIRGGVSCGCHYENGNFIFSKALIDAFELESKKAVYPRIIFDKKLADLIKDYYRLYKNYFIKFGLNKMFLVDWDGIIFINPFNYARSMDKVHTNGEHPLVGPFSDKNQLKRNLTEVDLLFMNHIQNNVTINLQKFEFTNYEIFKKYKWIHELIQWNKNPNTSKIKFEYFLE